MHLYPDYYPRFKCIASACRHNCCIGWEIDIDETSLARYQALEETVCRHISLKDTPHFVLQNERCPFLNQDNLCDLILCHGEEILCDICKEHPRFHNTLPDRTESGLGLCCEAAASLILSQKEPMRLIGGVPHTDDEILCLRDEILTLLQQRALSIETRLEQMLCRCQSALPALSYATMKSLFLSLERLEEGWTARLRTLSAPTDAFREHMKGRETEYEQLCVYLIYRHFATAEDRSQAGGVAAFTALCYGLLYALGSAQFEKTGAFSPQDQIELCRQFSAEIEYSDKNMAALLSVLS